MIGNEMKNTEEKILAAARSLFEEKGFAAATTNEIAEAAGVSQVTLFRHFETKRNLFERAVHSCVHPYKVEQYLKDGVKYDLRYDLNNIAHTMMKTYRKNAAMFAMLMRDKERESMPAMHFRKRENSAANAMCNYFSTMHKLGKLNADPKLAMKFYFTNITGYFMKEIFANHSAKESSRDDAQYFDWMIDLSLIHI